MDGVLVIDKPAGMTSHDVVDRIRKTLRTKKVGHGGTLDPDATGVLIVGVGKATRFLSYSQAAMKKYDALVRFGTSTTTQDASGEVVDRRAADVDEDQVEHALRTFVGDIEQVPPMVSAVKVGGERLYKKALRGEEVERPARRVTIYEARLTDFRKIGQEPATAEADISVACSAGTYVRTLAHDLGAALGCGAHLGTLRRTASGGFTLDDAVVLDAAGPESLKPLADIVRDLPHLELDPDAARRVRSGRPLENVDMDAPAVALISEGELLGVYRSEGDRLVADRVVAQ